MSIPGLTYRPDFITPKEETALLAAVDGAPWLPDVRRCVQHRGYRYDYRVRTVDFSQRLWPLPSWAEGIVERRVCDARMPERPDQMIVNEYLPGQGIGAHVDIEICFGPVVSSLTLGSGCLMELTQVDGPGQETIELKPRSLLVLEGNARYRWKHGIPAREADVIDGQEVPRSRRVSFTFRTVIL
jgi:alkylated DNA repair dioxygenase AlkB